MLDPNAVIGKAYQLNLFTMKDGRVMSGVIKEESPAAVKIAMMGGVEFTLPQPDIAKREVSKLSTMPEGLFDALKPEQVIDLVKYLQSGAAGPAKAGTTIPGAIEGEGLKVLSKTGGNAKAQGMGAFGGEWSGGSQPVSYTHLDVYKRQDLSRELCRLEAVEGRSGEGEWRGAGEARGADGERVGVADGEEGADGETDPSRRASQSGEGVAPKLLFSSIDHITFASYVGASCAEGASLSL